MREGVLRGLRECGGEVERLVQALEVEVTCERGDEPFPVVREPVVRLDLGVVESREVACRLPPCSCEKMCVRTLVDARTEANAAAPTMPGRTGDDSSARSSPR